MHLLFVGDGPRDEAAVPRLVERILSTPVESSFQSWKNIRLSRGSGYRRRIRFALAQARELGVNGMVATVDSDRSAPRKRLDEIRLGRSEDRQDPRASPMPAALGEAVPHLEAWLLDDPVAVRNVLRFSNEKDIPNVQAVLPKDTLNNLIVESERDEHPTQVLAEIANELDRGRCNHSCDNGLDDFVRDVRAELGQLLKA